MSVVEQYKALLTRLHAEIVEHRGDTMYADGIRDAMDACWDDMTDAERAECKAFGDELSAGEP